MKCSFLLFTSIVVLTMATGAAHALQTAVLWHEQAGDASGQFVYDVAIDDATGRVAIAGAFGGTQNFGGGAMTSAGMNDGFVVVFESDGTFVAQRQFGDATQQYAFALDWSSDSFLSVTGYFEGSANFGGSTLTSAGATDIFLARYDYRLTHLFSKRFGDTSAQYAFDVAVDASKNIVITGYFQGSVDFGGGARTSLGNNDVYVAKFNIALVHAFSQRYGDAGQQYGQGVDTDAAGNMYLCGYFAGTVNFGGSTLTSAGGNDVYVAKLSTTGVHQWSKRFGDASNQVGSKISASSAGDVYATGYFAGTINLGGALLTSAGGDDIFLAKFSTTGGHQWSQRFGDATNQFGLGVACDDAAVYIGGQSSGTISFSGSGGLIGQGGRDMYIARFSTAGVHVWSKIYGDASDQFAFGVDTGMGRTALAGYFQGTIQIKIGDVVASAGSNDAFLLVASTNGQEPAIKSITDVAGDQGRRARVRFERSGFDDGAYADPITSYEAYVEEPLLGSVSIPGASPQGGGVFIYVGSIPAHADPVYTMIIPTFVDSTITDGDYDSRVYIRAAHKTLGEFNNSVVTMGSSIDNLAPGMSSLRLDLTQLQWNASDAPDVDYYAIYGNSNEDFGGATLIDYTVATEFDITASARTYYFVTATDFSGNESLPSKLRVYTGIDHGPAARVLSISAFPNPFNPSTTLRYTVPVRGRVRIDVYDARGGRVTRIIDEDRVAGAHTVAWDGADGNGGRASSGVYFARITQGADTRTYKLVLIK